MRRRRRPDARRVIGESVFACYIVAALQAVAALVLAPSTVWDALIFAGVALWLHRSCSRIAAAALLLLTGSGLVLTTMNLAGAGMAAGGRNLLVAAIVTWAAVRATAAAFRLPSLRRAERLGAAPLPV